MAESDLIRTGIAGLLATLGHTFLQTRYDTAIEANRLAEMTRLRDLLQQRTQELTAADRQKDEFRPDVVLLDIGLPKMNGYEVAHRIRHQPWGQGMVLIALTGWGQETDRHRSQAAGFDHHLVKPVDPAALLQLLASLP